MMTSWHGNAFCITGPLWGESTGHLSFTPLRASNRNVFLLPWTNCWPNSRFICTVLLDSMTPTWGHCYGLLTGFTVVSVEEVRALTLVGTGLVNTCAAVFTDHRILTFIDIWNQRGAAGLISYSGQIVGLRPANERRRYKVTPSLIGWAQV